MKKKTFVTPYAISSLLLLVCLYTMGMPYSPYPAIDSEPRVIAINIVFNVIAALFLCLILVAHFYYFLKLTLPKKNLIELGLSVVFFIQAIISCFYVSLNPGWLFRACFLFFLTLFTALLFGKKPKESAPLRVTPFE